MEKNLAIVAVVLTVSCLSSLAYCDDGDSDGINVEGQVYCDPCRVQFPTRVSKPIEGAKVKLECRSRENETVVYTLEGETNEKGIYTLPVHKDFQEQICEVTAVESPKDDCNEKFDDIERARILITKKNGIESKTRYANPLGFMKKETSDECKEVLKELFPDEDEMPEEFKKKIGESK
ncbi:olee1-like protein [Rosa sericea]